MTRRTRLSLVGVLCLVFVSTQACTQANRWETYNDTGRAAYQQGNYPEAEKQWVAALEEAESFGPEDPRLPESVNNLAVLYQVIGQYAEAEPLYQRALAIWEKALGPEHLNVATSLENYANLLRKTGREEEAAELETRAQAIRAQQRGKAD